MPGDDSRARVAAQVVSGIGFLGAGVILREGLNVRGLNTAVTSRNDSVLEQVIGRLSLEPKISAVKWQVASEAK